MKQRFQLIITLIIYFIMFMAFAEQHPVSVEHNEHENNEPFVSSATPVLLIPFLGAPFDTWQGSIVNHDKSCLNLSAQGVHVRVGNKSGVKEWRSIISNDDLANDLRVTAKVDYGIGPFVISAEGKFASSDKTQSLRKEYIYEQSAEQVVSISIPPSAYLDPDWQELYYKSTGVNSLLFRYYCGDSYISQVTAGIKVVVKLSLDFSSMTEKQNFEASAGANLGIGNIVAKIKMAAATAKSKTTLNISAMQLGGEPEQLISILRKGGGNEDGLYSVLKCGSGDVLQIEKYCEKTMVDIANYNLESQVPWRDPDQYIKYLTFNDDQHRSNPVFFSKGQSELYPLLTAHTGKVDHDLKIRLEKFNWRYLQAVEELDFLRGYEATFAKYMSTEDMKNLHQFIQLLAGQIGNIFLNNKLIEQCYTGYYTDDCPRQLSVLERELVSSDQSVQANPHNLKLYHEIYNNIYTIDSELYRIPDVCKLYLVSESSMVADCMVRLYPTGEEKFKVPLYKFHHNGNQITLDNFRLDKGQQVYSYSEGVMCNKYGGDVKFNFYLDYTGPHFRMNQNTNLCVNQEHTEPVYQLRLYNNPKTPEELVHPNKSKNVPELFTRPFIH